MEKTPQWDSKRFLNPRWSDQYKERDPNACRTEAKRRRELLPEISRIINSTCVELGCAPPTRVVIKGSTACDACVPQISDLDLAIVFRGASPIMPRSGAPCRDFFWPFKDRLNLFVGELGIPKADIFLFTEEEVSSSC